MRTEGIALAAMGRRIMLWSYQVQPGIVAKTIQIFLGGRYRQEVAPGGGGGTRSSLYLIVFKSFLSVCVSPQTVGKDGQGGSRDGSFRICVYGRKSRVFFLDQHPTSKGTGKFLLSLFEFLCCCDVSCFAPQRASGNGTRAESPDLVLGILRILEWEVRQDGAIISDHQPLFTAETGIQVWAPIWPGTV